MSLEEQAAAELDARIKAAEELDAQVKAAEEQTRKAMEELQRHGQSGAAVTQLGGRG